MSTTPVNKPLIETLKTQKVGLFATKGNCDEAMEYGKYLFNSEADKSSFVIACMIYHNTLLDAIIRKIEKSEE